MRVAVTLALLAGSVGVGWGGTSARAADLVFKPIDTEKLVIKPTQAAADLVSQTIKIVGTTTASVVEKDGFVKTINNLFRSPTPQTRQPNGLPLPSMFPSTHYKSYNTPMMPILGPTPGRR